MITIVRHMIHSRYNRPESRAWWLAFLVGLMVSSQASFAGTDTFEISGSARVRTELKNNSDFQSANGDYVDLIGSRFRLDMKFKPNDKINVFFQPQFTKIWGDPEFVASGAAANTQTNTSGATHDTGLDVHQAFVSYQVNDPLSLLVGRKELNYGDQLLVGGVGWSNVGRAFDLIQGSYKYSVGSVEAFGATVKDTNAVTAGPGERSFSGLYSANRIADYLQNVDAYVFSSNDSSGVSKTSTAAYGLRVKSPISTFDYRAEVTLENVKAAKSTDENQFDLEAGYIVSEPSKTRVSVEYFSASRNFDQLYPTGHKWLGYADLFSRRNIAGFRVGASTQIADAWSLAVDYHSFHRSDSSSPAYKFNGTAYGVIGTDSAVASEADMVVGYKVDSSLGLEAGAARVSPGDYLKTNGGGDFASFYYLQVNTSF